MLDYFRDKNDGTRRSGEGGRRAHYVTPGSELLLEGERESNARKINGMRQKKKKKMNFIGLHFYRAQNSFVDRGIE